MNKYLVPFILLCFATILSACQSPYSKSADLHGFVIDRSEQSLFVVSKHAKDFSEHGGVSDFYDAIYLDNAPGDVEIGDEVNVWFKGGVDDSYPSRGVVGKMEVLTTANIERANRSQKEAVQDALQQIHVDNFVAITDVQFSEERNLWTVTYKPIKYFETEPTPLKTIEIEDS